ncbi:MAG: isoprenyl transferase, partial [Myxococcota bacterium]
RHNPVTTWSPVAQRLGATGPIDDGRHWMLRSKRNEQPIDPLDYGIRRLPNHVAIIMDGNGRWAKNRGSVRLKGHHEGAKAVRRTLSFARRIGVRYLTLYAFSEQNWGRPPAEVEGLMSLLMKHVRSERDDLKRKGIRFRTIGNIHKLSSSIVEAIRDLEDYTADNTGLDLIVALSYGGREELVHAVQRIAAQVAEGNLQPTAITEETISGNIFTADVPDPDLLIRTSGEMRVSNFMLWQLAYTELYVTDTHWPDFDEEHFVEALRSYNARQRRFGLTGDQARS